MIERPHLITVRCSLHARFMMSVISAKLDESNPGHPSFYLYKLCLYASLCIGAFLLRKALCTCASFIVCK